jgi:hypothetical protein
MAERTLSGRQRFTLETMLITFKDTALGFREGFVVRDPDGHALRIVEP